MKEEEGVVDPSPVLGVDGTGVTVHVLEVVAVAVVVVVVVVWLAVAAYCFVVGVREGLLSDGVLMPGPGDTPSSVTVVAAGVATVVVVDCGSFTPLYCIVREAEEDEDDDEEDPQPQLPLSVFATVEGLVVAVNT